jgi:hypothetical protein
MTSRKTAPMDRLPLGRPRGLPLIPGWNRVSIGGRPYPTALSAEAEELEGLCIRRLPVVGDGRIVDVPSVSLAGAGPIRRHDPRSARTLGTLEDRCLWWRGAGLTPAGVGAPFGVGAFDSDLLERAAVA